MKNKILKITSIVLAMVFALGMIVYAEGEDTITMTEKPKISVSSASGDVGDIVEVSVVVENNPGVASAGISVGYDNKAFKLVEVSDGGIWGESMHSSELSLFPYTLTWFNPLITESIVANGTIATLKFEILPEAKVGNYDVSLHFFEKNMDIIDADMNYVDFEKNNGKITIGNPEVYIGKGDNIPDDGSDEVRKQDTIFMCIGESIAVVYGSKTYVDPENKQVVPYITNGRTMVPLRFVSESIGAEVLWEEGWDYCIIKKDDKEIKITFGSAEFTVNGETYTYDAPIEVVMERTMVPVRFISEHLGYDVYWQNENQAIVITPADNPWVENKKAEATALMEILVTIKGILP